MKLLLTRQQDKESQLSNLLQKSGHQVIFYPCIEISTLKNITQNIELDFAQFNPTDIIWTSQVALNIFNSQISSKIRQKISSLVHWSIGLKTNKTLTSLFEIKTSNLKLNKEPYNAQTLIKEITRTTSGNESFYIPRALKSSPLLTTELKKLSKVFFERPLYDTILPSGLLPIKETNFNAIIFTSSLAVNNFCEINQNHYNKPCFVLGEITRQSANDAGFKFIQMAKVTTNESLVDLINSKGKQKHE